MLIQFDLGDWSEDGHGKTLTLIVESNCTVEQLHALYAAATSRLGWALDEHVCNEYEEHGISADNLSFLEDLGYVAPEGFDPSWVTAKDVFDMFTAVLHSEDPEATLVQVELPAFFRSGPGAFQLGYGTF